MIKYIIKRILMMTLVLVGVALITFTMMKLSPGNPEDFILGETATSADKALFREQNGLDKPYYIQFLRYIFAVAKGDLGISYTTKVPVIKEVEGRFSNTFKLAVFAVLFASVVGVSIGVISAVKQYSWIDSITMAIAMIGVSMPPFWEGLLLILFFAVFLGLLPPSGSASWRSWIMPSIALGTTSLASIMRQTRSSMLEEIRQDYVVTARAKGLNEYVITTKHVLKNALLPIVTVIGYEFSKMLGGAAVIEIVFGLPGVGKLIVDAINVKDVPTVQGGIVFIAVFMSMVNLLVDIIYTFVDPRLRSQFGESTKKKGARKEMQNA